ncbi:MAG: hypothetical protein ACREI3_09775 [Nitrospirales bacterium]
MNDTAPDIEQRYRTLLLARSGEERLKMGCSMHGTSQALVRASVLERNHRASPATIRHALFLRFYGRDFDPVAQAKILRALEDGEGAGTR